MAADLTALLTTTSLVNPAVANSSGTAVVQLTNRGDAAVTQASQVRVFASKDAVLDNTDVLLGQGMAPASIAASASASVQVQLTVPGNLQPGRYFLLTQADATNVIAGGPAGQANNVAVGPVEVIAAQATTTWIGGANGDWNTGTNWSGGVAPTATDIVGIGAGVTVNFATGAATVAGIYANGGLNVSGGTLTITGDSAIKNFSLTSSGIVETRGQLSLTGTSTVSGQAVLSGTGTIFNDGTMSVSGTPQLIAEMQNRGTISQNGGFWQLGATAKMRILDGGVYAAASAGFAGAGLNVSGGVVSVEAGGAYQVGSGNSFVNQGATLNVDGGRIDVAAGAGIFDINGTLRNANLAIAAGAQIRAVDGAQLTLAGAITSTGMGTLNVQFSDTANGHLNIAAEGATLDFAPGTFTINGAVSLQGPGAITNLGDIELDGGVTVFTQITSASAGTIHSNQGTALNGPAAGFHMLAGSTFFGRGALAAATADTQGLVVEAGARLVASGTLNTGRMPIFVRGGTVEAQGGFGFNFEGPVSFTNARFLANGNAAVTFRSTAVVNFAGTITGSGPAQSVLLVEAATVNLDAAGVTFALDPNVLRIDVPIIQGPGILTLATETEFFGSPTLRTEVRVVTNLFLHSGLVIDGPAGGLLRIMPGATLGTHSSIAGVSIGSSGTIANGGRGLVIEKGGTLLYNTLGPLSLAVPVDNRGTININQSNFTISGPIAQISGTPGNLTLTGGTWIQGANASMDLGVPAIATIGAGAEVDVGGLPNLFMALSGLTQIDGTFRFTTPSGGAYAFSSLTNNGLLTIAADNLIRLATYTQTANGKIVFGVPDPTRVNPGRITASASAALAGDAQIALDPAYFPLAGQNIPLVTAPTVTGTFATFRGVTTGNVKLFDPVYTPTSFGLNGLVNATDLAVENVTAPPTVFAGDPITVTYTVHNVGPVTTASTTWTDSIYLSKGNVVDGSDILLGTSVHVGALAAGASYTSTVTVPIAGALPAGYRIIVVTDARGEVADINRTNNSGVSSGTLDIRALTPGVAQSGTIANGQDIYFRVDIPSGRAPSFTLTGAAAGEAEIYVSLGAVPTRSTYDHAAFDPQATLARVTGDPSGASTYFILLHGREGAGTGQTFSLLAESAPFALISSSTATGSNTGFVSTTFLGTLFTPQTTFALRSATGTLLPAHSLAFRNSTSIDATFDLRGLTAGNYAIVATDPAGGTSVLNGALNVLNNAAQGQVSFQVSAPAAVRPPFAGTAVTITYSNTGFTDANAPLFTLVAENARLRLADQSDYIPANYTSVNGKLVSVFELLGVSGGQAGTLSPGESGRIDVVFEPIDTAAHGKVNFEVFQGPAPNTPFSLAGEKAALKPVGVADDAWNAIFANLLGAAGTTIGSYQAMLADNANYLGQFGPVTPDTTRLLQFELDQAGDFGAIADRYVLGAFGRGNTGPMAAQAVTATDGTVTITDGSHNLTFSRQTTGAYVGTTPQSGVLTRDAAGALTLVAETGDKTVFRSIDGRIDYTEDSSGNRRTATRNASGQLVSITDSINGDTISYTYNVAGRIATMTDPVGRVTNYTYDAAGEHLLSATSAGGTISYTYVTGQGPASEHALASVTSADGVTTTFAYDTLGRLIRRTNGSGAGAAVTSYAYDTAGKVTITDGAGRSEQIFRTFLGQIARSVDPLGNTVTANYNSAGRPLSVTDPNGGVNRSVVAADGSITGSSTPDRAQTSITYSNGIRRVTSVTDPGGDVTKLNYDSRGNLLSTILPDGSATTNDYDANGRVTATTDADGRRTNFTYNPAGLLTQRSNADGTVTTFTYDARRNLLTATDNQGTTAFTYDAADRITGVTYPNGKSVAITYDAFGRRTSITDQSGYKVGYTYDALGRLAEVLDGMGTVLVTYSYNAQSLLVGEARNNGTTTVYSYDASERISSITHRDAASAVTGFFQYTYDKLGQISTMVTQDGTTFYGYDLKGQLVSAVLPNGRTIRYSYDAEGNRTVVVDSVAGTTNYTTNLGDEYTSVGAATLVYDRSGKLVSQTQGGVTTTYAYTSTGQLQSIISPSSVITYRYDALGNRIGKTENGVHTDYSIDPTGLGTVIGEYSGATTVNYAQGLGLAARSSGGSTAFYQYDAIGNTSSVSGAGGAVLASYKYLPFGELSTSSGKAAQPFTYGGRNGVLSDVGNLYFDRARTYDAALGRFTTRDPLGLRAGDTNLYRYVNNNPVNRSDPSGLEDIFLGGSFDAIEGVGFTGGIGAYSNVADFWDTGIYISPGIGAGQSAGGSIAGGFSSDISGFSRNYTVSEAGITRTVSFDTDGNPIGGSAGGTLGSGTLLAGSATLTYTFKLSPRTLLNALGVPNPTIAQDANQILSKAVAAQLNKPGDSDLFRALFKAGLDSKKSPQDAFLDALLFLRKNGIYDPRNPNPHTASSEVIRPGDPNNIIGPAGAGADVMPDQILPTQTRFDGFVADGPLGYRIEFENKPSASAPAQVVTVTQQLDSNLDWSTFQFNAVGFGSFIATRPVGSIGSSFSTVLDATATLGVKVRVDAAFNTLTGLLTATFTSLDPATNAPPIDPLAGFLPPENGTGRGDGFLTYSINAKSGLADGTRINARATIVFDTEPPLQTPSVFNTIDASAPTVAINRAAGQSDPATGSTVNYTVVFSEAVTGFDATGIVLGGTAGATTAVVTGSGTTYNVAVSGMTTSGTVIATVAAGAAFGRLGFASQASTSTDDVVNFVSAVAVNHPPVIVDQTFSLPDNSAAGTVVGKIAASDPDTGETLTFTVTGGTGTTAFGVDSNGAITVAKGAVLNANNTFTLNVTVTDNGTPSLSSNAIVTIALTSANKPPVLTAPATVSVPENTTVVTTVMATDPNAGATLTFALTGADAALFKLTGTGNNRTLSFVDPPNFEKPGGSKGNNLYDVTVVVSDGTLTDAKAIAVTVTRVNAPPLLVAPAAASVPEETKVVTTVKASDPDAGATLNFSLSGADAKLFQLTGTGNTRTLAFITAPEFKEGRAGSASKNVYNVTVMVNDGSLSASKAIVVTVTDDDHHRRRVGRGPDDDHSRDNDACGHGNNQSVNAPCGPQAVSTTSNGRSPASDPGPSIKQSSQTRERATAAATPMEPAPKDWAQSAPLAGRDPVNKSPQPKVSQSSVAETERVKIDVACSYPSKTLLQHSTGAVDDLRALALVEAAVKLPAANFKPKSVR